MVRRKSIVLVTFGLLVLAGVVYSFLRPISRSADPAAAPRPKAAKPTAVHTVTVQRGAISQQLVATGDVLAAARVEVFPKIAGHLRELWVEEGDHVRAGRVRPGLDAHIRVDAYPGEVFEGTVQRLSPIIDAASRNGEAEISMANPEYRLKPGMFAKVALLLEQRQEVVVIPRDALHVSQKGAAVFVVQDGKAHRQEIVTGLQTDTQVEVLNGLGLGTEIVLAGHDGLKDQAPVRVVPTGYLKMSSRRASSNMTRPPNRSCIST